MRPADHTFTFTFTRAWIHRGVPYQPGESASLSENDVSMLAEAGAGERIASADEETPTRRRRQQQSTEPA